jgi:serpin B
MRSPVHPRRALIVLAALGLLACASPQASLATATRTSHRTTRKPHANVPHQRPPSLAPAPATAALSLDLLRTLGPGNIVFSPDSIATGLAMVGTGAEGRTAAQIAATLHLSSPAALAGVGALQQELTDEQARAPEGNTEVPTLDIGNGLFLQEGFPVDAPFVEGLARDFGAKPQTVNFEGSAAVPTINAWVSAHTQGLIPELFSSLDATTRLVLADAIYLKAAWRTPFAERNTAPAPFHAPGQTSTVPFMNETASLPYARASGWTAVEMPYGASTLSLLVVLPTGTSLATLEHRLDPSLLTAIAQDVHPTKVALSIPRIHLSLQTSVDGVLHELGVTEAFTERADFSRISPLPLKIGAVEHAADLKIDEAGTVAAAATGIAFETTAIGVPVTPPVRFDANRPFLFFLRDDRTGAVLFAGRLLNAATAQG